MDIQSALSHISEGNNLSHDQCKDIFALIMTGETTDAQIGAFLASMRVKGETADELAGAAQTMRNLSTKVDLPPTEYLVDTCGTGGSGAKLFNISTAAAFVAAAAGANVAKHGNRKATSFCGSADLLEVAGVNLNLRPEQIAQCIKEIGVGFMFAPSHHNAMRHAAHVRQELGIRTMMNILGPMTNPAGAQKQVIGVFSPEWQRKIAEVLLRLGSERALVVHSAGLDEIRLDQPTNIVELRDKKIEEYSINPEDFGIKSANADSLARLVAHSAEQSLELVYQSLTDLDSPAAEIVSLNAGAAIYTSGITADLSKGVAMAQDAIASGQAREKLAELTRITKLMS